MRQFPYIIGFLFSLLVLAACDDSGTPIYDSNGGRAGSVSVAGAEKASVYDRNEARVGQVDGKTVYDKNGGRVGRIEADGSIYNRFERRMGKVEDGKRCLNRDGGRVGEVGKSIDPEAAGGGCLLLLLSR